MAEDKKKILVYADWGNIFDDLKDSEAGKLIKHFFGYVRDQNPEPPSRLIKLVFEPIKQQLKRDLVKWENFKGKQSDNGKKGGRPPKEEKPNNPSLLNETQKSLPVTVTDTDTVKKKKKVFVPPSVDEFKKYFFDNGFQEAVAVRAWNGYNESDWHDTRGKPVLNWKSKCQNVWFTDENKNQVLKSGSQIQGYYAS